MVLRQQSSPKEFKGGGIVKLVSLAICSLGIWVILNSFLGSASIWEDIVFGAIAAILAGMGAFRTTK